jgi:hypothetical protein
MTSLKGWSLHLYKFETHKLTERQDNEQPVRLHMGSELILAESLKNSHLQSKICRWLF